MKIPEYNQMMAYLMRPKFNGGGYVKKRVLPKKKPEEEVKKRKIKNFEKAKPALENPKEVKEMNQENILNHQHQKRLCLEE